MMSASYRIHCLIATLAFSILAVPQLVLAEDSGRISVEPQPLAKALQEFSEQSGLQVAYVATLAENVWSKGTSDAVSPNDAMVEILDSTGLDYQFVNEETIAIGPDAEGGDGSVQPGSYVAPVPDPDRATTGSILPGSRCRHDFFDPLSAFHDESRFQVFTEMDYALNDIVSFFEDTHHSGKRITQTRGPGPFKNC